MTDPTCSICADDFNASNRKPVRCPFESCAKTTCRSCYETFLCGDDVSVPKCMFCRTAFTYSQLQHLGLTKSFLQGPFARHQEDILFAQEQAMLPAAQAAVVHDRLVKDINDQIKDVSAQIKQLTALKNDLVLTRRQLLRQAHDQPDQHDQHDQQFIHRCADSECNGFVSSAWKCATCDKHTCVHCRELKAAHDDPLHVCNTDTVASVALLKRDTKPCPNCKVLVHKTEGCDQMFCTQCKRLWSWNTGRFETRGHNPHYLMWMRENGGGMPREPGDVLCGREIDHHFLAQLHHAILAVSRADHSIVKRLQETYALISSITHLRFHDIPRFVVDRVAINLPSRKAFVSNALSLHKFKLAIRRNHVISLKHEAVHTLLQAVMQATTDIAFRFHHEIIAYDVIPLSARSSTFLSELHNLIAYANHEFAIIHRDFHSTPSQRFALSPHSFTLIHHSISSIIPQ